MLPIVNPKIMCYYVFGDFVNSFIRITIIFIASAVLINGIGISLVSNFNAGIILTFLLGLVLLAVGVLPNSALSKIPHFIFWIFGIGLLLVVAFVSFLLIFGSNDNVTKSEGAVIVLGAAVHGERPSNVLADRLDAAAKYHKSNPSAEIVVTGGKGMQEDITEAAAMEKYLIAKGVPKDKILKEVAATNTHENFVNSKKILDEYFGKEYTACFVTNEYHIFRGGQIAKKAGLTNITHLHSDTRWHSLLPGTLRECLGVMKYLILGR